MEKSSFCKEFGITDEVLKKVSFKDADIMLWQVKLNQTKSLKEYLESHDFVVNKGTFSKWFDDWREEGIRLCNEDIKYTSEKIDTIRKNRK